MPSLIWAVILAGIVLAGLVWVAFRNPYLLLNLLLFGLLFQEQLIRLLRYALEVPPVVVQAASFWKELLLVALLPALVVHWIRAPESRPKSKVDFVFLGALALAGLHTLFSPDRLAGLAATRNHFQPLLVFYLTRGFPIEDRALRRTLWVFLILGIGITAFGIWQAIGWDVATFERWGYVHPEHWIPSVNVNGGFRLRPLSTVAGPNVLGSLEAMLTALSLGLILTEKGSLRKLSLGALPVFLVGLAFTYSRSAMLTLGVGGAVCLLLVLGQAELRARARRQLSNRFVLFGSVAAIGLLFAAMLFSGMGRRVLDTILTLPTQFHTQDKLEAFQYLLQRPAGVGMGLVGPREGLFFPEDYAYHVESSLLQLAFDMGIWGLALWLTAFALLWLELWGSWQRAANPDRRLLAGVMICLWPGFVLSLLFLPLMQNLTLMAWFWFFSGVGMNTLRSVPSSS